LVLTRLGLCLLRFFGQAGLGWSEEGVAVRYAGRLGLLLSVLLLGAVAGYSEDTNPFIATNDATGITFNSADLHGTTNPAGSPTAAWFEWGKTTSFGNRTDAETFAAGTTTAVTFVTSIRNLEPHTTYYFR